MTRSHVPMNSVRYRRMGAIHESDGTARVTGPGVAGPESRPPPGGGVRGEMYRFEDGMVALLRAALRAWAGFAAAPVRRGILPGGPPAPMLAPSSDPHPLSYRSSIWPAGALTRRFTPHLATRFVRQRKSWRTSPCSTRAGGGPTQWGWW